MIWFACAAVAAAVPGVFIVLEGAGGVRFIRVPRHAGDMRPPLYIDMRTLTSGQE